MASSTDGRISSWLHDFLALTEQTDESTKELLIEPLRESDPVFTGVCATRVLICEVFHHISRLTLADCRLLMASASPFLLWMEWTLNLQRKEGLEDDLLAVELALLATCNQIINVGIDTNGSIRFLAIPSSKGADDFPFNVKSRELHPFHAPNEPSSYPLLKSGVPETFDEHRRVWITWLVCRTFQEWLNDVSDLSRLAYLLLLERWSLAAMDITDILKSDILNNYYCLSSSSTPAAHNHQLWRSPTEASDVCLLETEKSSLLTTNEIDLQAAIGEPGFDWISGVF
ncbi:unnamed protein product [Sphagnum compactum]